MRGRTLTSAVLAALLVLCVCARASAATPQSRTAASGAIGRGVAFLVENQDEEGSWRGHPGITGLALTAILTSPLRNGPQASAAAQRGLDWLVGLQREDGAVYIEQRPNYNTAIAILAMVASGQTCYHGNIARAQEFLLGLQEDEDRDIAPDDPRYGGIGYGTEKTADMSNMHYAMEALAASGLPQDSPAWEKAVVFLSRCQNLSATNDQAFASDDGGFVYSPTESKAGSYERPDGRPGLRSYGGMTYAGLLSFIHAKVDRSDPRVIAAVGWIGGNWTLETNPGLGTDGLYYYYHTFAKALDAYAEETIVDASGASHDWRRELVAKLVSLQKADGSWANENPRWFESDPVLVTSYVLIALERATGTTAGLRR